MFDKKAFKWAIQLWVMTIIGVVFVPCMIIYNLILSLYKKGDFYVK